MRRWWAGWIVPIIAAMFRGDAPRGKPSAAHSADCAERHARVRTPPVRGAATLRIGGVCARCVRRARHCRDATLDLGAGFANPSDMLLLLLLVLILAVVGGGFGHSRFGYAGWSPAAIVVVILVILALTGRL